MAWFFPVWHKSGTPNLFSWFLTVLDVRNFCKLSLYAISRKVYDPNSRKGWKTSFWARFRPTGPKFGCQFFFFKIWLRQSLDIMFSYRHVKYQNKLMIQSWEISDGRMDRREWFHRTLTNWRRASKMNKIYVYYI